MTFAAYTDTSIFNSTYWSTTSANCSTPSARRYEVTSALRSPQFVQTVHSAASHSHCRGPTVMSGSGTCAPAPDSREFNSFLVSRLRVYPRLPCVTKYMWTHLSPSSKKRHPVCTRRSVTAVWQISRIARVFRALRSLKSWWPTSTCARDSLWRSITTWGGMRLSSCSSRSCFERRSPLPLWMKVLTCLERPGEMPWSFRYSRSTRSCWTICLRMAYSARHVFVMKLSTEENAISAKIRVTMAKRRSCQLTGWTSMVPWNCASDQWSE
mmetsp:Transcript_100321/g.284191  ORF Transcript_100321/g.284191 Transcript_100321/m.284191 type:complete len:268 (+) Transcript_100321:132-935(+)